MQTLYDLLVGPLAWIAFGVFVIGSVYRLLYLWAKARKKDGSAIAYMTWPYGLRSIVAWLIPFKALGWKQNPWTTVVTFVFHIGLFLAPIFLMAHIVLFDQFWGVSWIALPNGLADVLAIAVVICSAYFIIRRLVQPEVKYVTQPMDWFVIILVFVVFLTGVLAYHQFLYKFMIIVHILSGEIMLACIPFTRLSHMIISPFTRAYMGSEFGYVRKAKDW